MSIKRVLPYAPAPAVTAEETGGSTLPPQCSEAVMAREEGRRRSSYFKTARRRSICGDRENEK